MTLHYMWLHDATLHYATNCTEKLSCMTLRHIKLAVKLHCIIFCCIAFTSGCVALHYIRIHMGNLHRYTTWIHLTCLIGVSTMSDGSSSGKQTLGLLRFLLWFWSRRGLWPLVAQFRNPAVCSVCKWKRASRHGVTMYHSSMNTMITDNCSWFFIIIEYHSNIMSTKYPISIVFHDANI